MVLPACVTTEAEGRGCLATYLATWEFNAEGQDGESEGGGAVSDDQREVQQEQQGPFEHQRNMA